VYERYIWLIEDMFRRRVAGKQGFEGDRFVRTFPAISMTGTDDIDDGNDSLTVRGWGEFKL